MTKRAALQNSLDASASYVEESWDDLTDAQVLTVKWSTDDPLSLPKLESVIPANLGEFQIELAYDLAADDAPVPCSHCPQHQKHRHGFVLKEATGRRFLLGSTCGPKAYGSDYRLASDARGRMERRHKALLRWAACSEDLTDEIMNLVEIELSDATKAVRRARGTLDRLAPLTMAAIRSVRVSGHGNDRPMSIMIQTRNFDEEDRINSEFLAEVSALTDLKLSNKEFNLRRQEIVSKLGWGREIITRETRELGNLIGVEWLLSPANPAMLLTDTIARLRGLLAIGRSTQDHKTGQIERLAKLVESETAVAEEAVRIVSDATKFFDPAHLVNLCAWLNGQRNPPCSATTSGRTLHIFENGHEISLSGPTLP